MEDADTMKIDWMMNNSKGKPDAMLTFATGSFVIVSLCILLSCFKSVAFRSLSLELTVPDTSLLLGFLASTFGAYVMRRNKEHTAVEKENK